MSSRQYSIDKVEISWAGFGEQNRMTGPTLKMKRALVRRTGIPLPRFRASCEVMVAHWNHPRDAALYVWERPDTRGGKSWVGSAYRVTLELWNPKSVRGSKWCGKVVDPLIPDSPQLRDAGVNRCNLPEGHELQWGPRGRGHCWTHARQICGNNRPRGQTYFTATEEDASLKRATQLALVELDKQIENDWHVVRLDPSPEYVANIVWGPQLPRVRSDVYALTPGLFG